MNDTLRLSDRDLLRLARRRVGLQTGWLVHAAVYGLVNLFLLAVNLAGGGPRWHVWPLAGWGLGLAIHGAVTLVALRGWGLRERMVAAEVERLRGGR
jgi:hypothetical protein